MGTINDKPSQTVNAGPKSDKPLKPCCACPETKKARDDWYAYIYLNIEETIFLLQVS